MADNIKWFKLTNTMFEDEKIEYLESLPDGDAIITIWVKILCLASKCNNYGDLTITKEMPYTVDLLSIKFKKTPKQIEYALTIMAKLNMVDLADDIISVSNWAKYQSISGLESMKEYNKIKQREHRERQKETKLLDVNDKSMTNVKNPSISISNSLSLSINNIYTYWNSKGIITHKELTAPITSAITKALKTFKEDDIKKYIDRYKQVLDDKKYFFDYKWTLEEFLKRKEGIGSFTDEGSKWANYQEDKTVAEVKRPCTKTENGGIVYD